VTSGAEATWIITGMSGAGKATALRVMERRGYTCVDNLPAHLLGRVEANGTAGVAVVIDARQPDGFADARDGDARRVIFLDARDDVLAKRLSESIRPHPLATAGGTQAAISAERALLEPWRGAADVVIDTSLLTDEQLRDRLAEVVGGAASTSAMVCTVSSFGFKFGPQIEADWVIDARFLRNPFWDPALRPMTGEDPAVADYIFAEPPAPEFVERTSALLGWVVAQAEAHGRVRLHVAIGCTGGRHRSVAVATRVAEQLRAGGVDVVLRHRDIDHPDPR